MTPYESHQVDTLTVHIYRDADPSNPRTDQDNLGTMICFHPRYALGDEHDHSTPEDFLNHLTEQALTPEATNRWNRVQDLLDRIPGYYTGHTWGPKAIYMDRYYRLEAELARLREEAMTNYIILPLFLYEHGGITISTGAFSCPWDSGQVGWIYMTLQQARENWPNLQEDELREAAERLLCAEVEEYDAYLRGDAWGYIIIDADEVDIEPCWGLLGLDTVREEALAAARAIANSLPKQYELSL